MDKIETDKYVATRMEGNWAVENREHKETVAIFTSTESILVVGDSRVLNKGVMELYNKVFG